MIGEVTQLGVALEQKLGTYDSSETNTADGSGSWKINACDNNNNRLQSAAAFAVDIDNYTFTFYVKGTAGQVITPWFFCNRFWKYTSY